MFNLICRFADWIYLLRIFRNSKIVDGFWEFVMKEKNRRYYDDWPNLDSWE